MNVAPLAPGLLIAQRYRLVAPLGRGAQASVWEALDQRRDGSVCALKFSARIDARTELEALARVEHPALAKVLDVGPFERGLFVALERVNGQPLDKLVGAPAIVRAIFAVSEALAVVHDAGLVHGDIKPANILANNDRAWLVDFGLAASDSRASRVAGSLAFMAPEALAGERNAATDLYALGVTAAWALCRTHPLVNDPHDRALLLDALAKQSPARALLREKLPEPCRDAVLALLSAEPSARGTARTLLARLARDAGAWLTAAQRGRAASADLARRAVAPLVGRERELERGREALGRALLDQDSMGVVVTGVDGSGRARLAAEILRATKVLFAARGSLCAVVDELTVEPERPTVVRMIDAPAPRVLAALTALARLRRFANLRQPVAILATCAPPVDEEAQRAFDKIAAVLPLGPLPRADLRALLHSISGRTPTDAALAAFVERSEALPGRFARLVSALDPAEAATATAADVEAAHARASDPASLSATLEPAAVEALERLLVAGAPLPLAALGVDELAARRAWAALSAMGLAHARDGLVSASAERDELAIPAARRAEVARSLLRWLDASERDEPVIRARVASAMGDKRTAFLLANRVGGERDRPAPERLSMLALAHSIEPGDRRVGLALGRLYTWVGESALAERALESLGDDSEVLLARIDALRSRGASEPARALRRSLDGKRDRSSRVAAAALFARESLEVGRVEEARVALDAHEPDAETNVTIALRWTEVRAYLALVQAQPERAQSLLREVAPALSALDDDRVRARFSSLEGMALQGKGAHHEARECYARSWTLAQSSGDTRAAATYAVNLGAAEWLVGALGEARTWLERGVRALAAFGTAFELARALANLAMLEAFVGERGRAMDLATRAERAAIESKDPVAALSAAMVHAECTHTGISLAEALASLAAREASEGRDEPARQTYARAALVAANVGDESLRERYVAAMAGADTALAAVARFADSVLRGEQVGESLARAQRAVREDSAPELEIALLSWISRAESLGTAATSSASASLEAKLDALARSLSTESAALFRDAHASATRAQGGAAESVIEPGTRSSVVRWKRLAEVARELNSEQRLRPLLERIMDAIVELTGATRGFLLLAGPDGTLRVRSARNLGRRDLAQDEGSPSRSIAERVARTGEAILTIDAASDGALSTFESVTSMQLRSVLAVPLVIKGVSCGTVYVDDRFRAGAFGDGALEVAREFAEAAALAIHNARSGARLRRALRKSERLTRALSKRVETQSVELEATRRALVTEHEPRGKYEAIIGRGAAMRKTLSLCDRVAATAVPVLLLGESGTGKELIARAIHQNSPRVKKPFVAVNCAALTETLLESELFGHLRGAFTGADRARQGLFEVADGGTLFLDEVGEMSAGMQAKLLRVLQDGEVRPIGGTISRRVDVRIVAATLRDLPKLVEKGTFREDLYYRLAVLTVQTPSLRERREDIPVLVQFFLNKHGRADVKVDRRALARMVDYPWPGNVRQLENEVLRAALLCDGVLRESDLDGKLLARELDPDAKARSPLDLRGAVEDLERKLVERALRECRGNQTKASKALGLSRFGLQKMLKRLKLEDTAKAARD